MGVSDGGYGLPRGQLAGVVQLDGLLRGRLVVTDTAHTRRVEGYLRGRDRRQLVCYFHMCSCNHSLILAAQCCVSTLVFVFIIP